jgi:hypothetical protein
VRSAGYRPCDADGVCARIARLEFGFGLATRRGQRVMLIIRIVVRLSLVIVCVGSQPVMMLGMIVLGVIVDVQGCDRRGGGCESSDEEGRQRASHWRESTQVERNRSNR